MVDRAEKPLFAAKTWRSRACSPIATATRGVLEEGVDMIPNGMFAMLKCDPRGMLNQDLSGGMMWSAVANEDEQKLWKLLSCLFKAV
jgi:hypothetical protein